MRCPLKNRARIAKNDFLKSIFASIDLGIQFLSYFPNPENPSQFLTFCRPQIRGHTDTEMGDGKITKIALTARIAKIDFRTPKLQQLISGSQFVGSEQPEQFSRPHFLFV